MTAPTQVVLTIHAQLRAAEREVSVGTVVVLVLDEHQRRRRNPGPADWLISDGGVAIAYDWPANGNADLALVVTVWRE